MTMRISTCVILDYSTDENCAVVSRSSYEYAGPVAQMKKGRKQQEQLAAAQQKEMEKEAAEKWRQLSLAEPIVQDLEAETNIRPLLNTMGARQIEAPPTDAQKLKEWYDKYM